MEPHLGSVRDRRSRPDEPRFQSGIRYSPTKDIIYGRNLTGNDVNWITFARTVRIGEN